MNAGGLAQMSRNNFLSPASSGLASRRGAPIIGLPLDTASHDDNDVGPPTTARLSRSHLLRGLRTAPKESTTATATPTSSTTTNFAPRTSTASTFPVQRANLYEAPPKTAMPLGYYNVDIAPPPYAQERVLAPPQLPTNEQSPEWYHLFEQRNILQQQQMELQRKLLAITRPDLSGGVQQSPYAIVEQQQLLQQQQQVQQQQQLISVMAQPNIYTYFDQNLGRQMWFADPNAAAQFNGQYFVDQSPLQTAAAAAAAAAAAYSQQQYEQARMEVLSPSAETHHVQNPQNHRANVSPVKRDASPPLDAAASMPSPSISSSTAFRRGHKKMNSLLINPNLATQNAPPKSAGFVSSFAPGHGRAGEHPVRQPRGPPCTLDELKAKPTSKHEGSKNFAARTRRSAVHNLVRAGLERSKGTNSSSIGSGTASPVSESAEEASTPVTDNESDSGRSGSVSLSGEVDCSLGPHLSANGAWGAIGSDRPSSRQKSRNSLDGTVQVTTPNNEDSTFAAVFKNATQDAPDVRRKAPMLVLSSADRRKSSA